MHLFFFCFTQSPILILASLSIQIDRNPNATKQAYQITKKVTHCKQSKNRQVEADRK